MRFEQADGEDGGSKFHPIWITCILLGHLFRERHTLGRVVKMYARFKRRKLMQSLVQINDLEEQVEPPQNGTMGASSSAIYKGDAMEVEESVSLQEKAHLATQLSPRGGYGSTKMSVG